jgi:hypothetical protein
MTLIERLRLDADALARAMDRAPERFAAIRHHAEQLQQATRVSRDKASLEEIAVLVDRIETFFDEWRSHNTPGVFYVPPREISDSDPDVKDMLSVIGKLRELDAGEFLSLFPAAESMPLAADAGTVYYGIARICLNGHVRSEDIEGEPPEPRCSECGTANISACQKCQTPIRGYLHVPGVSGATEYRRPNNCHECGVAYPWTAESKRAFGELIGELKGLSAQERRDAEASFDDLIADTPRTNLAVLRLKKLLPKAGADVGGALKSILVNAATAYVKQQLGLQ